MRYGQGFYAPAHSGLSPREQTRQREIEEAWDELVTSDDERDQLLALLRLKRYAREANLIPPVHTPTATTVLSPGVPARAGRISQ